ncbi:hypothetical protein [Qaidamihabitans albus]|uniref:hypothetical protein n=1 Tax=Qaidamihabitans albus TaxID=2795733 RepID=UPI0018F25703|nr:hypothetical protein [Qaidamihabitans albus]
MTSPTSPGDASRLSWPDAWRSGSRPAWLAVVALFALLAVAVLGIGVFDLGTDTARATFLMAGSPIVALAAVLIHVRRSRGRPRGESLIRSAYLPELGEHAVLVPYARWIFVLYLAAMAYSALLFGFLLLGGIARAVADGFGGESAVLLVLLGGLTGYTIWFLAEAARGRIRPGYVALSPSGVYHRSWALTGFFPWSGNIGARAVHVQQPMIEFAMAANASGEIVSTSPAWRQSERKLAPHLVIRANWLAVDPALLLAALRFYRENPAALPELGGEAGAVRLREHRLPPS